MPMEGQEKVFSPQNTAGVSKEKGVAVISHTSEANGNQVSKLKKKHNKTIKCPCTAHLK